MTEGDVQAWSQQIVRMGNATVTSVENKSETIGFDAQTEEYSDLVQAGIIDPAKVVGAALQERCSSPQRLCRVAERSRACHAGRRRNGRHGLLSHCLMAV
jgi:hypothetical protein